MATRHDDIGANIHDPKIWNVNDAVRAAVAKLPTQICEASKVKLSQRKVVPSHRH
ncbi:predicted protein [Pyrenophora tritici-repentis Pt-1C-BFP]|uniref:Uncharacterized protein n=1 Tax=Pyrenophora tritici-repentis (strain Pt-1C-BFP) TaxID=426418 RepID=B2W6V3_PYRTR|nr:uncharacterized protein PTRG_05541 [Pyrenophora tritici-repentis Pt-1C-BFP]EDU48461.1 predicted protein [Pyrenophora tritici-repentis Pt-1C-BFP]